MIGTPCCPRAGPVGGGWSGSSGLEIEFKNGFDFFSSHDLFS